MLHSPSRSRSPTPSVLRRGGGTSTPPLSSRSRGSPLVVMIRPQQSKGQAARRRDIPLLTNDFLINVGTAARVDSLAGWNLVFEEGVSLSHTKRLRMATRIFGPPLGEALGAAGDKVPICRWLIDLSSNSVFTTPAVTSPTVDEQSQGEGLLRIESRPPLHVTSNLSRVVELFLGQTLLRSNPPLTATPRLSNASRSGLLFVPVESTSAHWGGGAGCSVTQSSSSFIDVPGVRAQQRVVEGTAEGGAAKLTVTLRNARMQLSSSCPLLDFIRTVVELRRAQRGFPSDAPGGEWLPCGEEIADFNRFLDTEVRVVHGKERASDRRRPRGLVVSCDHTGKKMYYTILRIRRCSEELTIDGREMPLREYYETYRMEGKKDWTCVLKQQEGEGLIVAEDWKGRVIPIELCQVEAKQLLSMKPLTVLTSEPPKTSLSSVWLLRERLASSLPLLPRGKQQRASPSNAASQNAALEPDLEVDVQRRPLAVKGRLLPEVTLEFRDKQKPMPCSQGSWVITGQEFKQCAKYRIPYGVLEVGECGGVAPFCEALRAVADGHGLKFQDEPKVQLKLDHPGFTEEGDVNRLREWCRGQLADSSPAILLIFLPKKSRRPYCIVKDLVDRIAGIPSQVIVSPSSKRTINQWQSIMCELCCKVCLKEPQAESPDEDMDGDEPSLPPPSPGVLPKSPPRAPLHGGVVAGVPRMTQQTSLFAMPNGRGGGGEDRSLVPRGCMVMAFTLERSEAVGGFWIASAVGSVDNDVNLYATASSVQDTGTRILDIETLTFRLLERFYIINSRLPQRIIAFRNAFPSGRFLTLQTAEFRDIANAISDRVTQAILLKSGAFGRCSEKMRDRLAREKYCPSFTLMSVSHGSSQSLTLWCEKPQDCDRKTGNVPAGMIVDGTVTQPNILNFYLVSQQCHTGTARPTHYMCLHDDNYSDPSLRAEELQQIVWSLCHLSARCTRTTSRPAPLVYAEALAKRVDCYLEANNDEARTVAAANALLLEDGLTDKLQGLNFFL